MYRKMYKFVFLPLGVLLLANLACRVKAECIDDGLDCILDKECCTGYCDWQLSVYPYTGGCAPRPSGPTPPKPCIPLYSGGACVYNETCCQGYCERRYSAEGFCYVGPPLGDPPVGSPGPPSLLPTDDLPPSPSGGVIPGLDVPVVSPAPVPSSPIISPAPVPSSKKGSKKKHVAPAPGKSKKNRAKNTRARVAPSPAPTRNVKHELKKKHAKGELKCARVHAPSPACIM